MDRVNGADWFDIGGGKRGFRAQNAGAGIPGTEVTDEWLNDVQEELLALIEKTGGVPATGAQTQLLQAIRSQKLNYLVAGGTANAITVAADPAIMAYTAGLPLRVKTGAADNSGAVTINAGPGLRDVRKLSGEALVAGDLLANTIIDVVYDAVTNQFRISGLVRSDMWITSDTTITVGSNVADNFATIPAALDWLKLRLIAKGATVTLALRAEEHVYDGVDIVIDHPHGKRIRIVGANLPGAAPAYADFACTGFSGGQRAADAATNLAMLQGKYASKIWLKNGARIRVENAELAKIDKVLVRGDGGGSPGIMMRHGYLGFGDVSLHGFGQDQVFAHASRIQLDGMLTLSGGGQDGIEVTDTLVTVATGNPLGTGSGKIITSGNTDAGIEVWGGSALITNVWAMGNGVSGLSAIEGAGLRVETAITATKNGTANLTATRRAHVSCPAAGASVMTFGGTYGIYATDGAVVSAVAAVCNQNPIGVLSFGRAHVDLTNGFAQNASSVGARADAGGYIIATGVTTGGNLANYSPALNTVGNGNSYIMS